MRCIYCLEDRPHGAFIKAEHVIPQSMGVFENNLTLHDIVCDDCNQYLGDTIELVLGRGSYEALLRVRYGVQPSTKLRKLQHTRVRLTLPRDDEWHGLVIELVPEGTGHAFVPVPQVGLRTSDEEPYSFVVEEDLQRESSALPPGPYSERGILIVSNSAEVQARLIALLENRGIHFKERDDGPVPGQPSELALTEITVRMDRTLMRCAAKIAFNYLAHREGRDFVLQQSFDTVRDFIRHGAGTTYPLVVADDQPILADDFIDRRQTNGHLLTISWAADGRSIVGQVSLFNHTRYCVSLARRYSGIWRPLRHGHHFSIETRKVSPLFSTELYVRRRPPST